MLTSVLVCGLWVGRGVGGLVDACYRLSWSASVVPVDLTIAACLPSEVTVESICFRNCPVLINEQGEQLLQSEMRCDMH